MDSYDFHMKNFDAKAAKNAVVEWIRNKMNSFGTTSKAVIGISGGKDSSVVAALCAEAIGKDRVYGVMMPNGDQYDIEDSKQLIKHLGIHSHLINIKNLYEELKFRVKLTLEEPSNAALINMAPRLRMTALYAFSQTLDNAYVVNTSNWSESWIGYSTHWGDDTGDFAPIASFVSDEVIAIGDACGLPYNLTHKIPSDGLCGKTDEDNFGFTYHELNKYLICHEIDNLVVKEKIDVLHNKNVFKLKPIDKFQPTCYFCKDEFLN